MLLRLFFLCVILQVGVALPAFAQTSALKVSKPVRAKINGLTDAYCVRLNSGLRVCKGQVRRDEESEPKFILEKNGATLGEWPANINIWSQAKDFEVMRGDLDGDGSPELIVVDPVTVSNGLGVAYFDVRIFPDPVRNGFQSPLTFTTEDYGSAGTFVRAGKEILILLAEWSYNDQFEPKRGTGMYLIGRWFRYRSGKLIPAADRPTLARRLLNSFGDERGRTWEDPRRPHLWLRHPRTLRVSDGPPSGDEVLTTRSGVIEKREKVTVKGESADEKYEHDLLHLRMENGELVTCVYRADFSADPLLATRKWVRLERVGFLDVKLSLPNFLDAGDVCDKLEGKKVQLIMLRRGNADEPHAELWFQER